MRMEHEGRTAEERGFTLLEVLISAALLGGILLICFRLIGSAQGQFATSSLTTSEEVRAEDLLRIVVDRVRNGGISTLSNGTGAAFPDGTKSSNGLRIRMVTGYSGGAVFGETIGLRLANDPQDPVDGNDNDGDGRIDESILHLDTWPGVPVGTPLTTSVSEGVAEFVVARSGNSLTFFVVLLRWDRTNQRTLRTTATQSMLVRN